MSLAAWYGRKTCVSNGRDCIHMNAKKLAGHFLRPRMGRRLLALAIGLTAMGVCIAVFHTVGFGTDPCSTFTLGVSARTGVTFGTCQLLFNLLMFIPVIRCDLSRIGIGTIGNMVGVGYIADFCMRVINARIPPDSLSMGQRVLMFAVSMAVFLVAASFIWWSIWALRPTMPSPS